MEQVGNEGFLESLNQVTWAENGKANAAREKVKEKTSDAASSESGTQLQWEMQAYQYPAEERAQINLTKYRLFCNYIPEKYFSSYYSSVYEPFSAFSYADDWNAKQDSIIEDMEGDFVIDYSAQEYQNSTQEISFEDSFTEPS